MRCLFRLISLLALVVSILGVSTDELHASKHEDVLVAKVGRVPVTVFEFYREQQKIIPLNMSFHGGLSEDKKKAIREEVLETLVSRAYRVNYAIDEEIVVSTDRVDKKIESFKKKHKIANDSSLKDALGDEGVQNFRASVYRELLAEEAKRVAVDSKLGVTDGDVLSSYEKNKKMYNRPRQFKARHILVKVDPSSNKEEKEERAKRARELADRGQKGEDFYDLAYYNSDDRSRYVGGDLGTFHEGQTISEFELAVKALKVGEVSDPVQTMYGWHIIKLEGVEEPRLLEYDEVKGKIRDSIEAKIEEEKMSEWMEILKAKYEIKMFMAI
ncbi:MAG: hypothetical protein C0621_00200 [Desulfuromonas sp.]|nr:MAG: hypothetical protein C0621_00200 [Desulfuromonas sp.]